MPIKIFRFNKFQRYLSLILSGLFIIVVIWFLYRLFDIGAFDHMGGLGLLLIPYPLFVILLIYLVWMIWSYRIEFWETEIRVASLVNPIKRYDRCAYKDIEYIRRPTMKGQIQIISNFRKIIQFPIRVDGGVDAVMDEFEKYVPLERFQLELRSELKKFSKYDKITYSSVVFALLLLVVSYSSRLLLRNVAWETVWSPGYPSFGNIRGFWIDDGTTWVVYNKAFENDIKISRISNEQKRFWNFADNEFYPDVVLAGRDNQPWLFDSDRLYRWTGSSWQGYQFQNYTIRSFSEPVVIEGIYWAGAYEKETKKSYLVKFDLNSGDITSIYLPNELASDGFSIWSITKSPDNSLYVMVTKPNASVFFYLVSDGQWERKYELADVEWKRAFSNMDEQFYQEYVVRNGEPDPILGVKDFAFDNSGQIWVITKKSGQFIMGWFNPSINLWEWSRIENDCNLCTRSYDDIVIDNLGRVWLAGEYGHIDNVDDQWGILDDRNMDVFLPHFGGVAEQITRFTNKNSNYQFGFGSNDLRLSADGYIWSAHDRVVRIDANQKELPQPLPDWVTTITDPEKFLPIVLAILIPLMFLTILWGVFLRFKDRSFSQKYNS